MRIWHRSCMNRTLGQSNDVQAVDTFPLGVWRPVGGVRSVRHMGLVEKVGPVRHTEARRKVRCKGTCRKVCLVRRIGAFRTSRKVCLARRMEACWRHTFFSALAENAAMGPDCMDSGTCCQETPRWGLFLGGYSSALFSENYVTWPFVELSYSVWAFAGFFLRNKVCREAPLSRFLPSGARDAAQFSCDAFRRKVSSSRDWSCFEYHVFYGCEQQKWKHQIGG